MNIHHLELFHFVARHGGISAAVRHMPYGIQQPAVSSQLRLLEEDLGVKLFERQPFRLTAEGEQLQEFVQPFFENIDAVAARLRRGAAAQLRLGASEIVLRRHMPGVIERVRHTHPGLRLAMRAGPQSQLEALLRSSELDLAILTAWQVRPGSGLRCLRLLHLPLVLLVPRKSKIKAAAELWARRRIEEPLVSSVPAPDNVFQKGLKRRGVEWRPAIEATSLELVTWYVAHGHGLGVNLGLPELVRHRDVRVLPLEGFDPVEIVAVWRGEPTPIIRAVLVECRRYVRELWPGQAFADELP